MPEDLRISADELRTRIQAGEKFTVVDARNPNAWAEAPDMSAGAIRMSLNDMDEVLPRLPRDQPIVAYCT